MGVTLKTRKRMSEMGRQRWESKTEAEKQAFREACRERWYAQSPEDQARISANRQRWYAENKPWRTPLYERMKAEHPTPEPCVDCGGPGRMQLAFDDEAQTVEFVAWRCYPCRKRD